MVYSLAAVDGKLFSGSSDNTIKIWDIKTGKCTATLQGHKHWVVSLAVVSGTLFSGSSDGVIKVWDIHTRKCTATFEAHEQEICYLAVTEGKLFSTSYDNRLKVWDFTAHHSVIFQEIAEFFERGIPEGTGQVFKRFSKMPKTAKHAIYAKLYQICKPFAGAAQILYSNISITVWNDIDNWEKRLFTTKRVKVLHQLKKPRLSGSI